MPNRLGVNVGNSMQNYLMKKMTHMFFIFSICLFSTNAFGMILNVGPGNYQTIQRAIDAATDGDTIVVADGTYKGSENKNLAFKGKAITLISENGAEKSIIDCEGGGRGFYFHSGEGKSSVLSGFTVRSGRMSRAGGISIENSSPTITNCIISGNLAANANSGGIGIYNSSPIITNCKIIGNTADMWGGGIGIFDSSPAITNCTISENRSKYWWGGGIVSYNSTGAITNCVFSGNSADHEGGAIYVNNSSPKITNCTISGNSADKGAGLHSAYSAFPMITNTILWSNSPDAISVLSADVSVKNSTIQGGWMGEGNSDANPVFMDPDKGNYRLKDYSSCIGAGSPDGAPDTDIEENPRPNPAGSNPDMGAYENSRSVPSTPPLSVSALEVDNRWTYQGTKQGFLNTVQREVIRLDQTTFPTDTYVFEIRENGLLQASEWYGKTAAELRLWGSGGHAFTSGLLSAWYPMTVGDHKVTSANVVGFPGVGISLTADVLSKGNVNLSFGTLEAYQLSYQMRTWGPNGDVTQKFWWWIVPHLGVVKDQRAESLAELTSFAIGGGTITQATDYDGDGLEGYQELLIYNTNWQYPDTDQDGLNDSEEISVGTDPASDDTDGDGLKDGWEVQYGFDPLDTNNAQQDPDGDNLNNLEEQRHGTNPRLKDTDQDGLGDGQEISMGIDPNDADTDDDGIQDGTEAGYADGHPTDTDSAIFEPDQDDTTTTDPLNPDSDGDGFKDGDEDSNHNGRVDQGEDDPNEACQRDPVRLWGVVPVYFKDIQSCYDAAIDGDIIEIHGICFDEDITFDHDVSVTLRPGYLCDYRFYPPATTTLQGPLKITNGTIRFGNGCMKIGD